MTTAALQFSYFKFPIFALLLCSAMSTLATEQRTGAELYLAASMWNQETAPTSWHLTQHSRIHDLHPLGLASKPPWGWTISFLKRISLNQFCLYWKYIVHPPFSTPLAQLSNTKQAPKAALCHKSGGFIRFSTSCTHLSCFGKVKPVLGRCQL